jgi:hypothetical protein
MAHFAQRKLGSATNASQPKHGFQSTVMQLARPHSVVLTKLHALIAQHPHRRQGGSMHNLA